MEVRIALEGVATASAAHRGSEEDLQLLQRLLKKMETSVGDAKWFGALDLDFHLGLAKASENQLILDLFSIIRGQLERGIAKVLLLPQAMPPSLKEHNAIFQAVKRREPEAARAAMQAHLDAAVRRYRKAVGKSSDHKMGLDIATFRAILILFANRR